jgi:Raf kinase inhibitor-like YbhB/YbcL family protein
VKPNSHHGQAMIAYGANWARMVRTAVLAVTLVAATAAGFSLQSSDIVNNRPIPKAFWAVRCGGVNRSPELDWNAPPTRTASFAIVMHDADAPMPGGFYHWVAYDIPRQTQRLNAGAPMPGRYGLTSAQKAEYHGPCPPPGKVHHYRITLYALDLARIEAPQPLSGPQLEARVAGHVLASTVLVGTAQTP